MRGLLFRVLVIGLAVVAAVVPLPASWVERYYSTGAYPTLQQALTPLSNRAPVALFDVFLALLLLVFISLLVRRRRIRNLLTLASVVWLLFLGLWGCNYRRLPIADRLDFDESRLTEARVQDLARAAVGHLNFLHPLAHANPWPDGAQLVSGLAQPFATARAQLGIHHRVLPGVPKRSVLDAYFRLAAIDGMTDPFFLGTILASDLLPFERPAVLAHEWGHLAGFADEAEASFIGWLICLRGDVQAQYAGWLAMYPRLMEALSPGGSRDRIGGALADGPRADLRSIRERLQRSQPAVRQVANETYDRFLKANRVEEGIRSYEQVVRLAAGTRFGEGLIPALR